MKKAAVREATPILGQFSDEELWAGVHGINYTAKFPVDWRPRVPFLRKILKRTRAHEILDVGCNAGFNLSAIQAIDPALRIRGLEINEHVAVMAGSLGFEVYVGRARYVGAAFPQAFDMVVHSGVLIHVPPELIAETARSIAKASRKWVLAVEYYEKAERAVRRRGRVLRTWARPYGAIYENCGLELVAHGKPGPGYPNCDYWLMRRRGA
jgi:SAM-dependent methyltransferase